MTKPKLFVSSDKSKCTGQPTALTILKKNSSMFMRLILNAQSRDGDVGDFFSSETCGYPPSLSENGSLRFGSESAVCKILFSHQKSSKEYYPPCIQARAFDAAATVQSLVVKESLKSFKDYKLYFWNHIKNHSVNVCRVDVVFDCYLAYSLKSCTRTKRGNSSIVAFKPHTVLPRNWHDFLTNSENKTALFKYLAQQEDTVVNDGQDVVVTVLDKAQIINSSHLTSSSLTSISPSDHEEADTRLLLHCQHMSHLELKNILISTVDSDVIVLCIHFFKRLDLNELWVKFGVRKNVKCIAINEIADSLRPVKCSGLTFFHAFSGCDTVSSFENYGKKVFGIAGKIFPVSTLHFPIFQHHKIFWTKMYLIYSKSLYLRCITKM